MNNYSMFLGTKDGSMAIEFANNTDGFVEVVFTINGKDIRESKMFDESVKGYCFPSKFKKMFSRTVGDRPLPFKLPGKGVVKAYVYRGEGQYIRKEADLEIPTFVRRSLSNKAQFVRSDKAPVEVLECKY